jgi:holliday junction DNA helicase RuvA
MIAFLDGIVEEAAPLHAVLNVGGVGYHLHIPVTTAEKLPAVGQRVRLFTTAVYREDNQALYGFHSREDRALFELLTEKVSGIGPKIALSIISRLSAAVLRGAVANNDVALLSKCPGIGRKTAERLCIELRDHIGVVAGVPTTGGAASISQGSSPAIVVDAASQSIRDAVTALMTLGYKLDVADKAVRTAHGRLGASATTEALIREALK